MSAAARGAAGALVVRAKRERMRRAAGLYGAPPIVALQQAERHIAQFVRSDHLHELAAEAVDLSRRNR